MSETENSSPTPEKEVEKKTTPKKVSKLKKARGNKKVRIAVILVLMAIVAGMFFFWGKAKIFLVAIFLLLATALGLEIAETDFDLGTLMETRSLEESKVVRDDSGNILYDLDGNITTNSDLGKGADEYNCDDFASQPQAQTFFERVGGTANDLNRLDGDKDGSACESLPKNPRQE